MIGDFSDGLAAWEERSFSGETRYRVVELDNRAALEAIADDSASALYREIEIDLKNTPCLHWTWRIEAPLGSDTDERSKAGDDYPARLYVVRRGGLAFWRTRALNYVWSSNQPVGSRWDNAYAGENARMWALDSGATKAGEWVSHVRDVRADWRAAFGEDIDTLDGVAVMTDADDTGGAARAWYADIRLSAYSSGADCVRPDAPQR
ncbi:DUF3047 domain-containing protein [Wenzhouxiangella sp. XN24]|nr:DUF3047 domain-containing protein [Wenzhouxiangella sp. XN24]